MANKVLTRVWEHSTQRGAARCLMLAIADVANEHGVAWPGIPHLAEMINETERHTYSLIAKLIEAGELLHKPGGGRGHLTLYGITCGLSAAQKDRLNTVLQNSVFKNSVLQNTEKTPQKTLNNSTPNYQRNGAIGRAETPIAKNDNHGRIHGDDDGDRARAKKTSSPKSVPPHVAYLSDRGMGAAPMFAHLDPDTAIADFDARRADGQSVAHIVKQWRMAPPTQGAIYGQPRSGAETDQRGGSAVAKSARGRHAPTGGSEIRDPGWMDRLIAKAESGEL